MTDNQKSQWKASRLFQTLAYFGVVPFVGSIKWLQKLFGEKTPKPTNTSEVVLVVGANGGVGKRVVPRLLKRGYQVRSLVRDAKKAQKVLGKNVEIVTADITKPETLTPEIFKNVSKIICCTGTRVQPVEGDNPNRGKYNQGIKFFMPEVAEDPQLVEYEGMKNLVAAAKPQLQQSNQKILFDFTNPTQDVKEIWGALDDVVMGGVSESSIRLTGSSAIFSGNVSTANSGGFVSVRTRNFEPPVNLLGYSGIELRVKGDGKRYKFFLRCEEKWDGVGYSYSFDTVYNIWMTIRIPFKDLIPVFRARVVENAQPFNPNQIYSYQLMLSKFEYNRELNPKFAPGFFQLEIESIKAYGSEELPKFVLVSSAGVTRPGRPDLNLDEQIPIVKLNDQLKGLLNWKFKGEEVVRSSGIPYTVIRPCGMTEQPGGQALIFDQGDNIKGLVSRDDIAELCVKVLEENRASNTTFEVKGDRENQASYENWEKSFNSLETDKKKSLLTV
ncbi:CIA30 family protein [Okeania sp.]|uniref:CIA30 family protein n=1 Tax=Okeania sp. TaxID=3100323 RepID=UPI002B4B9598|nr:CIA30 family protein [Okeania sp.]MEB3341880.1 CIA30 family protein [Okeania sp.]